jgi:hypothetical protein
MSQSITVTKNSARAEIIKPLQKTWRSDLRLAQCTDHLAAMPRDVGRDEPNDIAALWRDARRGDLTRGG